MSLECIQRSERSQQLKDPSMSPFVYKEERICLSCLERAHLRGIVKEFPTFPFHLQKILGGGFVSQIVPPLFLFLRFHAAVQAFAARWPTREREFT